MTGSQTMRPLFGITGLAALMLAFALPQPAAAQMDPATRALIERLRPQPGGATRGIRLPAEPSGAPPTLAAVTPNAGSNSSGSAAAPIRQAATLRRDTTAPDGVAAVSLTVNFPLGSATLTPEAERALAPLGRALASNDLASYRFRIEGHTDTLGDTMLNRTLSERRAISVRNYLESHFGVAPNRLEAIGFGDKQLLVDTAPQVNEPRNRRVQVLNIGS
jgi:outer membrane protein OmpA-like peptidoglycan-associated protein